MRIVIKAGSKNVKTNLINAKTTQKRPVYRCKQAVDLFAIGEVSFPHVL